MSAGFGNTGVTDRIGRSLEFARSHDLSLLRGCIMLVHFGYMNQFRQPRTVGLYHPVTTPDLEWHYRDNDGINRTTYIGA